VGGWVGGCMCGCGWVYVCMQGFLLEHTENCMWRN